MSTGPIFLKNVHYEWATWGPGCTWYAPNEKEARAHAAKINGELWHRTGEKWERVSDGGLPAAQAV